MVRVALSQKQRKMIGHLDNKIFSEWRVKVAGKQSCMGFEPISSASQSEGGKVMEIDWGKKLEVAPRSSDLSPHWSNIGEG